jgi:hypothetical protein
MECLDLIFYYIWTFENGKIKPSSVNLNLVVKVVNYDYVHYSLAQ